jgi:hypothetical protein
MGLSALFACLQTASETVASGRNASREAQPYLGTASSQAENATRSRFMKPF